MYIPGVAYNYIFRVVLDWVFLETLMYGLGDKAVEGLNLCCWEPGL